ncbi:MAG TPA: thiolase family protein [Mycobacteriales bacterium]|nr:thiolase family protein [Mycobacteriales bacterium]
MVDVAIVGIGIHPFGRFDGVSGQDMGLFAARQALKDAGVEWQDIQFAFGGSQDAGEADTLVSRLGLTGIPFVNVANGCATAGSALALAANAIDTGQYDLGLVVGFDKHPRGAFAPDPSVLGLGQWYGDIGLMLTTQFFAMKIKRYMHDHDISLSTLAKVAVKAYANGARNPNAWRRTPRTEAEVLGARMLNYPLTQYMLCSPNEGGAAVVVCRADHAHRYSPRPVYLRGVGLRTRRFGSFEVMAPWLPIEQADAPTVDAAKACFEAAGIGPEEVDVAQIQDGEVGAEIMHMAENGLCKDGEQEALIQAGETQIGGRLPINTDGGLLANGEPIGASGLRQVYETVLQLRGLAGERQVPGEPKVGYTQVYGAPGTGATTLLTT